MSEIKIIHIHTDLKFVVDSSRFEGEGFNNTIIVLGKKNDYKGYYKNSALFYTYSLKNLRVIIRKCKAADMVVLYDLNFPKAYIANRLPLSVKVIWRFFGLELYGKIPEYVLSEQTIKASAKDIQHYDFLYFRNKLALLYSFFRFKTTPGNEFEKAAFSRIDYFHGLSAKEYQFLKKIWPQLPPFLQISYSPHTEINDFREKTSNLIIIGNNRSNYNNHLDVIELIQNSNMRSKYQFLMFFSYGENNGYTDEVRAKAAEVREIKVLEDFLASEKFNQLYSDADALVLNGHRQMAMANIFQALRSNAKVYLNNKNVILDWLKEEGFLVFSVNNFISDLDSQKISLTENEAIHNQHQFMKFTAKYNQQEFHNTLLKNFNQNN